MHPTGSPLGFRTAGPAASSYISHRLGPALRSGLFSCKPSSCPSRASPGPCSCATPSAHWGRPLSCLLASLLGFFFLPREIRCETWIHRSRYTRAPRYTTMLVIGMAGYGWWVTAKPGCPCGILQSPGSTMGRHHLISSHPLQDSALGHVTFSCWKKEMLWPKSELHNIRPHFSLLRTQSITGTVTRGLALVAWVCVLSTKDSLKHQGKLSLLFVRAS